MHFRGPKAQGPFWTFWFVFFHFILGKEPQRAGVALGNLSIPSPPGSLDSGVKVGMSQG